MCRTCEVQAGNPLVSDDVSTWGSGTGALSDGEAGKWR